MVTSEQMSERIDARIQALINSQTAQVKKSMTAKTVTILSSNHYLKKEKGDTNRALYLLEDIMKSKIFVRLEGEL